MLRHAIESASAARGNTIGEWYGEEEVGKDDGSTGAASPPHGHTVGLVHKVYLFRLDRLVSTGVADTFAVVDEGSVNRQQPTHRRQERGRTNADSES